MSTIQTHDSNRVKIDDLLSATDDPVQKATLSVLSGIDHSLEKIIEVASVQAVTFNKHTVEFDKHRVEFSEHVLEEQKLLSGIKWAWWAATGTGTIIMFLGGFILLGQITNLSDVVNSMHRLAAAESVSDNRILNLERRQLDDERIRLEMQTYIQQHNFVTK